LRTQVQLDAFSKKLNPQSYFKVRTIGIRNKTICHYMTCYITNNPMFTFNNQYISIVATIKFPKSIERGKARECYTADNSFFSRESSNI